MQNVLKSKILSKGTNYLVLFIIMSLSVICFCDEVKKKRFSTLSLPCLEMFSFQTPSWYLSDD